MKPVFVLGLGAMKAGSSWLHKCLNSQEYAHFGFCKEYNVWDAISGMDTGALSKVTIQKPQTANDALRFLMQNYEGVYERYFSSLVNSGKDISMTGDISPGYSILTAAHLALIREKLEKSGFSVKAIFLMRDPIERNWSAYRDKFKQKNTPTSWEQLNTHNKGFKAFLLYLEKTPVAKLYTNYGPTIFAIKKVFPDKDYYIEFFENFFNVQPDRCIKKLEHIIKHKLENIDLSRVNTSIDYPLDKQTREQALNIEWIKNLYDFFHRKYPETKKLWMI